MAVAVGKQKGVALYTLGEFPFNNVVLNTHFLQREIIEGRDLGASISIFPEYQESVYDCCRELSGVYSDKNGMTSRQTVL